MLKQWIEHPLMDIHRIVRRQMGIGESIDNPTMRSQLRSLLTSVYDFERILSRVETGSVSPRDFASLRESLRVLPMIQEVIQHCTSNILQDCHSMIHTHNDLCDLLTRAIVDQPSLALKDGHVIRDGYSAELDELESVLNSALDMLAPEGRLSIISFHSLEDRIVKNKFKDLATACKCPKDIPICVCGGVKKFEIITKKPIIPIDDELKNNNRAHSSKLRILERILD